MSARALWSYEAVTFEKSSKKGLKDKIAGRSRSGEDRGLYRYVTKGAIVIAMVVRCLRRVDEGRLPQYLHFRCDIAGTDAVNLNIMLTPFVA